MVEGGEGLCKGVPNPFWGSVPRRTAFRSGSDPLYDTRPVV
jgi:hypothetical protein